VARKLLVVHLGQKRSLSTPSSLRHTEKIVRLNRDQHLEHAYSHFDH